MENGKQRHLNPEEKLISELQSPEYRRAFVEAHATDTVAFQLRAMRKAQELDQSDVAEKLGNRKLQPMISRYENPDYGKYSITTLLELAAVFDVALAVRFVPFSELVEWDLSANPAKELPVPFDKDSRLKEISNHGAQPEQRMGQLFEIPQPGGLKSGPSNFNEAESSGASGDALLRDSAMSKGA